MSLSTQARTLVEAPLLVENGALGLGQSVWLYLWLVAHINHRGYVCREITRVSDALHAPVETIAEWLAVLQAAGLITCEHPAPYLVIRLCFWSADADADPPKPGLEAPESAAAVPPARIEVPVRQQAAAADQSNSGEGAGGGEPDLATACRILAIPESEQFEVADILSRHPPALIRRALERVAATPASQIRKSRLALFRYLLARIK